MKAKKKKKLEEASVIKNSLKVLYTHISCRFPCKSSKAPPKKLLINFLHWF